MSASRRLGAAAYRRLIEAAPDVLTDGLDNRLTPAKARRYHARDLRDAARFADRVRVPSKWYATDGSGCFYYFRTRRTHFVPGDNAFGRLPTTAFGSNAAAAYMRHGGQITDSKPSGWLSAATVAAVNFGGLDGGPRDWGWRDNEDLDLDIRQVERLRDQDVYIASSHYVAQFDRAMAGAR